MERIADAFERIAGHLEGLAQRVEQHGETLAASNQWISDSLDDVADAIRGEPRKDEDDD